jgi:alkylation response protein AidB-like acyl-CoA dehydrogenase
MEGPDMAVTERSDITHLLDAVKEVVPLIEASADSSEAAKVVNPEVMKRLMDAGIAMLMVPAEFGGFEPGPSVLIDIVQELSRADGSTGWSIMASTSGTGYQLALLPEEGARIVAASDNPLMAGQGTPTGTARRVPGGYEVEGRYQFASGSAYAGWFLAAYRMLNEDGSPMLDSQGQPTQAFGVVPKEGAELLGGWDVMGLVATGSFDYEIKKQFVAEHFIGLGGLDAQRGGPLYTMGLKSLPGIGHGSWGLGIMERALDEFRIAASSIKRPPAGPLNKHATVQRDAARWHAQYKSARAFMHDAYNTLYDLELNGARITDEMKADCRLAATNAVYTAAEIARGIYLLSGSLGLRNGSVIQRLFRDAHAGTAHLFTSEHTYVDCGRIYLGTPGLTPAHSEVMTYTFAPPLVD